jgi:hypothetical protein
VAYGAVMCLTSAHATSSRIKRLRSLGGMRRQRAAWEHPSKCLEDLSASSRRQRPCRSSSKLVAVSAMAREEEERREKEGPTQDSPCLEPRDILEPKWLRPSTF